MHFKLIAKCRMQYLLDCLNVFFNTAHCISCARYSYFNQGKVFVCQGSFCQSVFDFGVGHGLVFFQHHGHRTAPGKVDIQQVFSTVPNSNQANGNKDQRKDTCNSTFAEEVEVRVANQLPHAQGFESLCSFGDVEHHA